jgi:hypothetical protein
MQRRVAFDYDLLFASSLAASGIGTLRGVAKASEWRVTRRKRSADLADMRGCGCIVREVCDLARPHDRGPSPLGTGGGVRGGCARWLGTLIRPPATFSRLREKDLKEKLPEEPRNRGTWEPQEPEGTEQPEEPEETDQLPTTDSRLFSGSSIWRSNCIRVPQKTDLSGRGCRNRPPFTRLRKSNIPREGKPRL